MKTKCLNDAKMLEEDLLTDLYKISLPANFIKIIVMYMTIIVDKADQARCYFYLGQSYICAKEYKQSIKAYKTRIYLCGWVNVF